MTDDPNEYPGGIRSFYFATLAVPCGVSLFVSSLVGFCANWDAAVCTFGWMMAFPVGNFFYTRLQKLLWGRLLERATRS